MVIGGYWQLWLLNGRANSWSTLALVLAAKVGNTKALYAEGAVSHSPGAERLYELPGLAVGRHFEGLHQ